MRALLARDAILERLGSIFPREAFDPVASNPLAAAAVAAMLYVDAIAPEDGDAADDAVWARPSTCLWLSDAAYEHNEGPERKTWAAAARQGKRAVEGVLAEWGSPFKPWYADNSRETLRDETFPLWLDYGAVVVKPGVTTTSSAGRWALGVTFADLFSPGLTGDALAQAIDEWRESHLSPGDRARTLAVRQRAQRVHSVEVTLPNGKTRDLEPGDASWILKGVVEKWAPARLKEPMVLTISEPGTKILVADQATLSSLGLLIDPKTLLPDSVIVDVGVRPAEFWIIEAVASDGPISEDRKSTIIRWAEEQRIPADHCRFLSAFLSRNDAAARRRLKDLAVGTFAWYADEPDRELAWYDLG